MQMANGAVAARDGVVGGGQVLGKRHADDSSLNDDQRFAKRFTLLRIGKSDVNDNRNHFIPVANTVPTPYGSSHADHTRPSHQSAADQNDSMSIDDTRDRVYINNLDDELADIESDEEKLIFLPDIEKRLSKLPRQVLMGGRGEEHENQELVLYSVPKSLTVDEDHDSVRKAILEARQRARERVVEEARQEDMVRKYDQSGRAEITEMAHGYCGGYAEECDADPDAMEID
ncbi:hypothetical protein LTR08_007991 [Meristemomyces frigidus]|nr:hypothetical protein LTR08_007991 [Meristemomyces frigidus]